MSNKSVIHIEMPRSLTFGVKSFQDKCADQLCVSSVNYIQLDTNLLFWEYATGRTCNEGRAKIKQLFNGASDTHGYVELSKSIERLDADLHGEGYSISLNGILPTEAQILHSCERILQYLEHNSSQFVSDFVATIVQKEIVQNANLISLGISDHSGLLWAIAITKQLKTNYPHTRVIIGTHHYENFSLLHTIESIKQNKSLFRVFDGIVRHEELLADSITSILNNPEEKVKWVNCYALINGVVTYTPCSTAGPQPALELNETTLQSIRQFIAQLPIQSNVIHYNINLIGNQCYYSKCTFCIQINKHANERFYEETSSIRRSFSIIKFLAETSGVRYFSFIDEAIRPRDLEQFCDLVISSNLDIRFNLRLIAYSKLSKPLISKLALAGCREVLFGLETINPVTAAILGKVSYRDEIDDIKKLIYNLTSKRIRLILSMIHSSPGAPSTDNEELLNFARQISLYNKQVVFIFNRFELFVGSKMYDGASDRGIQTGPINPEEDLRHSVDYLFEGVSPELSFKDQLRFEALVLKLPVRELAEIYGAEKHRRLKDYHHLNYASFGFTYTEMCGQDLYEDVSHADR